MSAGALSQSSRSPWLAYAQLVRLPNVFTAFADIALAALVTAALPEQAGPFVLLLLASGCLYCAGMVWNDYFDFDQDLRERPFRPLPSYRVSTGAAARLGTALVAFGLVLAGLAGLREDGWTPWPLAVAVVLVAAIFVYDAWLKRNFLGPLSMGSCRFFNVLLGLTVAGDDLPVWGLLLAAIVGNYIVGVTWFARKEARVSKQLELVAATLVMFTALALTLFLPLVTTQLGRHERPGVVEFVTGDLGHILFPFCLVAFAFYIGLPAARAIRTLAPRDVQRAVKRAVLGLVILDAILAMAVAGTPGLLILLLLPPGLALGKRIYST